MSIGILEALGAATIWGYAFVALKWSVDVLGPLWTRAITFIIVALMGSLLIGIVPRFRRSLSKKLFVTSALPGLAIGLCLVLQGLGLKWTTVANCGFITTLYVVFVPLGELLLFKTKPKRQHLVAVAIALAGSCLLCGGIPTNWNLGDILVLICAILAAVHFLLISKLSSDIQSPFVFNVLQLSWAGVFILPLALWLENAPTTLPTRQITFSILYLAIASNLIGFMLQVRSQKSLPASTASIICLLEAPFAAFFGFMLLAETMDTVQFTGALLVIFGAIVAARR